MTTPFETQVIDLAGGPVDLTAVTEIAAILLAPQARVEAGTRVFLQNISPRAKCYFAEQAAEPAVTDKGQCLFIGDGFTLRFFRGRSLWVWAASTGLVAISPVSPID